MISIQVSVSSSWWNNLTTAQKEEYAENNPNSKFSKEFVAEKAELEAQKTETKIVNVKLSHMFMRKWNSLDAEQQEFFATNGHLSGSKERKKLGKLIESNAEEIADYVRDVYDNWPAASRAVKKIATNKHVSPAAADAIANVVRLSLDAISEVAEDNEVNNALGAILSNLSDAVTYNVTKEDFLDPDATTRKSSLEEALLDLVYATGKAVTLGNIQDSIWIHAALNKDNNK